MKRKRRKNTIDLSHKYDMVCIYGMPYFQSKDQYKRIVPIHDVVTGWSIMENAWKACKDLVEEDD